jgi:hypothetical protein
MNKMKIAIAIPESRQSGCPLFRHKRGLMATKAEFVPGFIEGGIRILRIFVRQQSEIGGAVRFVAS